MTPPVWPRRSATPLVILAAAMWASACCEITGSCEKKQDCAERQQSYVGSFNTFLNNGAPVATFRLDQTVTQYQGSDCPLSGGGPVTLTITSTAPVPLRFEYLLQGLGATGLVVWSYQGSVSRIAPGQSIAVGQVATTPVRVDVGARASLGNVAQVP
jgi:hypothetical protein